MKKSKMSGWEKEEKKEEGEETDPAAKDKIQWEELRQGEFF